MTEFTVKAGDLARVLHNALLFMPGPGETNPAIRVVRIDFEDELKQPVMVATNRYVLSWETIPATEVRTDERPFSIRAEDARWILGKAARCPADELITLQGPARLGISFARSGTQMYFSPEPGSFPDWKKLRDRDDPDIAESETAFQPKFLAALAKVQPDEDTRRNEQETPRMTFRFKDGNKPSRISIGKNWNGLIMPVRGGFQ